MSDPSDIQSPAEFVHDGWIFFQGLSLSVLRQAQQALSDLAAFSVDAVPVIDSIPSTGIAATFVPPPTPSTPNLAPIVYTPPPPITLKIPALDDFGDAPDDNVPNNITYSVPGGQPGAAPSTPDPALLYPALAAITLPVVPTLTFPGEPELLTVEAIDAPVLTYPQFLATLPIDNIVVPVDDFGFTEQLYSSQLLTDVRARLDAMTQGGTGLPAVIENALFDRARVREDTALQQTEQDTADLFASRGFDEPPGEFGRRMQQAQQKRQDAVLTLQRDITIKVHEIEIENIRFACTQGMACEQVLIAQNNNINQRALEAAKAVQEIRIAIFNAQVAKLSVQYEGYKAQAQVFETRMRALQVQVDVYKTQVEAQKVISETNLAIVQVFAEEIKAQLARLEVYKAQLEGAKLVLETNAQLLAQAKNVIDIYSEEIKAYGIEWEGYKTRVEASLAGLRGYEILADVYGKRVQAWSVKGNVAIEKQKNEVQVQLANVELYKAQVQGALGVVQGLQAQADAQARIYSGQASVYAAGGEIAKAEADTINRGLEITITNANNQARLALEVQRTNLEAMLKEAELTIESLKGRAAILAQLAASVLSGAHFAGAYSGSVSTGFSYNKGFNYSGGTPDANPTF